MKKKQTGLAYHRITDPNITAALFALCWIAYFTCYIGRLNYSSAMTAMIEEDVFSKAQAGFISMVYFFSYGGGQLINGFLGDRLRPGRMIFTGLMASMACNVGMGFLSGFFAMAVVWGINGYAQAMIWPPIIRIFAQMLTEETKVRYCVNIVSTQALGTLASYLLSAGVLMVAGWRMVFFAAAACLLFTSLVWLKGFGRVERAALRDEPEARNSAASAEWGAVEQEERTAEEKSGKNEEGIRQGNGESFWKLMLLEGLLVIVLPVIVHGILKDGVTSWVPTYIHEVFHTSPSLSILVTTVLPVVNLTGAYAARFVYRKFKKREVKAAALFFGAAVTALAFLWAFGSRSLFFTVLLLSLITSSMMAVNTLFVNLLPLRFEKLGRVSSVSGFLNCMAYAGTAVSTFTIGIVVENQGWQAAIAGWVLITAIGAVLCLIFRNRFREEN